MRDEYDRPPAGNLPVAGRNDYIPSSEVLEPYPDFEDTVDLREYIEVVLRHKWLILSFVAVFFFASLVYSLTVTRIYRADGRLELNPNPLRVTKFEDVETNRNVNNQDFIQTQVKLLQSETLADRVIEKLNLGERGEDSSEKKSGIFAMLRDWRGGLRKLLTFSSNDGGGESSAMAEEQKRQGLRSWFLANLEVKPDRNTTVVAISFTSENPREARDVINAIVQEFIGWDMDTRIEAANTAKMQLAKQVEVARIQREVETSKLIHQSLLERSKEIDAKVGTQIASVRVVDYAALPLKPFKPNVMRNLVLALVLGLMGGVGLVFLREYLDNTVKHIDEVSDRFQIPILGVLPLVKAGEAHELEHLVLNKPRAGLSEAIRTAKVSIQLSNYSDRPLKSIVITSTASGEGKSTIASNLAQAFATSEEKVVLVDADLRKPRLHKVFGMNGISGPRKKGLSQYLSGICGLSDIVRSTKVPNLSFVSAGPIPPNPAELLASARMRKMLDELGEQFDRIIIDAPLAAGFADVLVLSHQAAGIILISTLGKTHRAALRLFRKSIISIRGHLLGCIVNKLNVSSHYGGYYYKYYRYYSAYYQNPYEDQESAKLSAPETRTGNGRDPVDKPHNPD